MPLLLFFYWISCNALLVLVAIAKSIGIESAQVFTTYGNHAYSNKCSVRKNMFWHFYVVGVVMDSVLLLVYNYSSGAVVLLHLVHSCRRLYEELCVSVRSSTARMSIAHYAVGITFYVMTPLAAAQRIAEDENISARCIGALVWIFGMYVQHDSLKRLAEIRRGSLKNKERVGQPTGGWFDYVSSPHFFGELLVYTGLCILQEFSNACMNLVLMFCVINQTLVALETHAWYVRTFKDYPKGRKAIIPFLL